MLIETYNLEVNVSKHSADEFEYEATAHLLKDIRSVLPYLNTTLRNGTYLSKEPVFSWRKDDHKIAFWRDRIAIDHLSSREEAKEMVIWLVNLVNDVWEKRGQIQPDASERENLQPLELYRLLPRTNCKSCGESTCFNFAIKLAAGQIELTRCDPIYVKEDFCEQLVQLQSLIATKRPLL